MRGAQMSNAEVISLEGFRKSREAPVKLERIPSSSDWAAIETMCSRLLLTEESQYRVRIILGALLIEAGTVRTPACAGGKSGR
jgi:hypothetical protein